MEDIKKEQYKKLVLGLLKTLFGKLSIEDIREEGKLYKHIIFDQNGEDIADIYLGGFGNKGCKKDLTLSMDATERLEGYVPYFRHKIFSKVLIDYVYDELGIKCDCVQYDYDFEREVEVDDDGEEYEYKKSNTRKYNVPMYLFELDGYEYLYLDMGDHEKFIDEKGNIFIENEIPERLGIDVMGLKFSDIIDFYFSEEDEV